MTIENQDLAKRIRLSKILGSIALVLLIASYVLGVFTVYIPYGDDEPLPNESYNPWSMFELELDDDDYPISNTVGAFLGGFHSMRIWRVTLDAPQYPESIFPLGIPIYFNLTRFSGEVEEMDTINHYIGMEPMEKGAPGVRKAVPIIYFIFLICIVVFLVYSGPFWWLFGLIPALMPVYFLSIFSYWLYWFGHNLKEIGAIDVKPFMPTVFGEGKVAQFSTGSYPTSGFYVLVVMFICLVLAVLVKRRALAEAKAE